MSEQYKRIGSGKVPRLMKLFIYENEVTNVTVLNQVYREENDRINLHAAARNGQNILINCALRNIDDSNPTCGGSSISSLEYDVDEKDSNGMTPLACTARFGRLSAAKCLLDHGANIEAQCGVRNWRPLHFATYYCHPAGILFINALSSPDNSRTTQNIFSQWSGFL